MHAFVGVKKVRLIGGTQVLDFLNTCNGRRPDTPLEQVQEHLNSFSFFFEWAHHAGLITAEEHTRWRPFAAGQQELLQPMLEAVKALREALFSIFYPLAQRIALDAQALDPLNTVLQRTQSWRFLSIEGGQPRWEWKPCHTTEDVTTVLIGRLADHAQQLLTGTDLMHLKCCSSQECDWLFLDSSKNKQRRWCQMSVCGSREKLQRTRQMSSDSA